MKKYNDLFKRICTINNFLKAYKNASKGKKDYKEVKRLGKYPYRYLSKLLKDVRTDSYNPGPYRIKHKWTGHKWRKLAIAPFKDRIVQHAIMIYCESIFQESFIVDTFSSIKSRGIHRGLKRCKRAIKDKDYNYVLQLDIHHCYESLDLNILKNKLANKFTDEKLLNLFYKIIDSYTLGGVPIGNYTSQYFNNFYFTEFDHYIKEVKQVKYYFRYCDDIVIFGKTKDELHSLLTDIKIKMKELHVELKPNYKIYPKNKGVDFLGYITYPTHRKLRKLTKSEFIRKCKEMDFNNLSTHDVNVLGSYWGILSIADCRNLWFKYTGVKKFSDLKVSVHERNFIKNLIGYDLVINDGTVYTRKGERRVKLDITYTDKDNKVHENIYVSSSGEMLIEAIEKLTPQAYPFETIITINKNGFYQFN